MTKGPINKRNVEKIKAIEGVYRKTLACNNEVMLCLFNLKKDTEIPLHDHESSQIGYIIKGKIHFFTDNREFIAEEGDSYVFDSYEKHGAKLLEETEVIEVFNPPRDEYK